MTVNQRRLRVSGRFSGPATETDLVLGARPDMVSSADDGQFVVRVDPLEQLGGENLVYCAVSGANSGSGGEREIRVRVGWDHFPVRGERLKFPFDASVALVFEAVAGDDCRE